MLPFDFGDDAERAFFHAWHSIEIVRRVRYSLFTFGWSDLPYYVVTDRPGPEALVSVRQGEVRIDRCRILTPDTMHPEFRDFFEDADGEHLINFLLARTMAFRNLKLSNQLKQQRLVSDSVEEIVAKLNRQLDTEDEDRVAILTAPAGLSGLAVLRYATERVMASAPDNLQELREHGFLP